MGAASIVYAGHADSPPPSPFTASPKLDSGFGTVAGEGAALPLTLASVVPGLSSLLGAAKRGAGLLGQVRHGQEACFPERIYAAMCLITVMRLSQYLPIPTPVLGASTRGRGWLLLSPVSSAACSAWLACANRGPPTRCLETSW